jgi:hypothetical protein
MKEYSCHFTDQSGKTQIGDVSNITANSPKEAAELFATQSSNPESHTFVFWGFGNNEVFENEEIVNANFAKEIAEARAEAEHFHSQLSQALNEIETKSYFELEVENRIICSGYFNSLIATFEKRGLLPIEIKFIKGWQKLKDRELGESLLAKNEMAKPKAQQGKSPLGNMLMAGMAISTMKLSQDIGAVSDQVENISEGFGFEG